MPLLVLSQTTSSLGQCFCAADSVANKYGAVATALCAPAAGSGEVAKSQAAMRKLAASLTITTTLLAPIVLDCGSSAIYPVASGSVDSLASQVPRLISRALIHS